MGKNIQSLKNTGLGLIKHPLFSGSAIMIIGSNFGNFLAYIYHLIVGRMLGPSSYGELSSIISIMTIFFTTFSFLSTVIVKFTASSDEKSLISFFVWLRRKIMLLAVVMSIILLVISPAISSYLNVKTTLILPVSGMLFISVLAYFYRSILQGLLQFTKMVIALNLELVVRMTSGILLIYLGYSVFGAVTGMFLGNLCGFLFLYKYIHRLKIPKNIPKFDKSRKFILYSIPIIVASVASNSLLTSDVIMAKHYLGSFDAGIYASLSSLGKIIFYGTGPIAAVMFPIAAKNFTMKGNHKKIFILSLFLTAVIASAITFIYWIFPDLMITLLYGNKYLGGSRYLVLFGLFISTHTITSLFINYFLSIEKVTIAYVTVFISFLQIFLIFTFHKNIGEIVSSSIASATLLLIILITYFVYVRKNSNIAKVG